MSLVARSVALVVIAVVVALAMTLAREYDAAVVALGFAWIALVAAVWFESKPGGDQ